MPSLQDHNRALLMPQQPNKDAKSRIGFFLAWLAMTGRPWYQPALPAYRDYLLHQRTRLHPHTGEARPATLAPATVQTHLATLRGRYEVLLHDPRVRVWLDDYLPGETDAILRRLRHEIYPAHAPVERTASPDCPENDYLRLTPQQVHTLLAQPGMDTLRGLRDTALIALIACTGLREAELVALDVADVRQAWNGKPALRVREDAHHPYRMIPYGPLDGCLRYVEAWLHAAQIGEGPLWRGFYKGNQRLRPTRLSTRTINRIMHDYPILIDGERRVIQPHDLRRTYARNAYLHGVDIERIRQNLGHISLSTTQRYIGDLSRPQPRPLARLQPSPRPSSSLRQAMP